MKRQLSALHESAFRFVLTMGIVNLFADMTYEGGASINGAFLGTLGAGAAIIGIIAGAGEFFGYSLRAVAGYFADRSGKYWLFVFIGYAINLLAVPAMALAGNWQIAALLIFAERIGRAMRKPTVEAMLSYTTGTLGKGWVYAVNTALDEVGATVGPLFVALVLFFQADYRTGFAALLATALLALAALSMARIGFPVPARLESRPTATAQGFTRAYWLYMAAGTMFAMGLMSYELIGFHLATSNLVDPLWVPALLAFATGSGVAASLVLGRAFDRAGIWVVLAAVFLSSLFAPFVFGGSLTMVLIAMPLWGIGYAMQDTLLKALIAGVLPHGRRNFAFGLFYIGYGSGWFIGSVASGLLYETSRPALILFVVLTQLAALPLFLLAARRAPDAG